MFCYIITDKLYYLYFILHVYYYYLFVTLLLLFALHFLKNYIIYIKFDIIVIIIH